MINLGDSLGLVYLRDGSYRMARMHNIYDYGEAVRVVQAGAIINGRIAGDLMCSRGFGDFHGKGVTRANR
jgi:serine/threonine protein phosphatase PrpC